MHLRSHYLLRPIKEQDLAQVLEWRNSDRIRANMFTDHAITLEEHRTWFQRVQDGSVPPFFIFECKGKPAGVVSLGQIDQLNEKCHWGFYVGAPDSPRGTGSIMGFMAMEHIFEIMNIRKLIGETFAFNQGSMRFHEKLGFVKEGLFVRHVKKNGNYEDIVSYALFREAWIKAKRSIEIACFGNGDHP